MLVLFGGDRGAPPGFKPTIVDVTIDTINREHRGSGFMEWPDMI